MSEVFYPVDWLQIVRIGEQKSWIGINHCNLYFSPMTKYKLQLVLEAVSRHYEARLHHYEAVCEGRKLLRNADDGLRNADAKQFNGEGLIRKGGERVRKGGMDERWIGL